jgi:hypothetical protein
MRDGRTWTDAVNQPARDLGILDITHDYVRDLAEAIRGEIKANPKNDYRWVVFKGHAPNIEQLLEHEDAWTHAIERLGQRVTERLEARTE